MVRQGDLGDIRQIHVEYFQDWAMAVTDQGDSAPWRLDVAQLPEGLLAYPTIADGVGGVRFVEASIESTQTDSWVSCAVSNAD